MCLFTCNCGVKAKLIEEREILVTRLVKSLSESIEWGNKLLKEQKERRLSMIQFNIRKKCNDCGLEYWEDGRVNNHSCLSIKVKPCPACGYPIWQPKDEKNDKLVSELGIPEPLAEKIWEFIEKEIVPSYHPRGCKDSSFCGEYNLCIKEIEERIRNTKGL